MFLAQKRKWELRDEMDMVADTMVIIILYIIYKCVKATHIP